MEAADPTRMEAVLCWTTEFFGGVVELQKASSYGELWKEHIPTLTNICRRKGMIVKTTSQTPLEAFENAKAALKSLNDDRLGNGRYAELNPSVAASGNETEIYKTVVLLLSAVTIYAVEQLEHEDCIQFMQKKNYDKVFANVLYLVNSPGSEWWQGGADSFDDSSSDPCFTSNSQDESFTTFEIPAIPSTPRSAIRRNTFVAPHSPIHSAVNSPLTMKKRQDEMRKRLTELADQVDHLQKQLVDSQDQERVLKNSLAEIKEKWREVDEECRRQTANYTDTEERLRDTEKNYADLVKDAKELQTRGNRYKADLENSEAAKRALADQMETLKSTRDAAVRELRDVTDDFGELQKKYSVLEHTVAALERQLETTAAELEQHERERKQISVICQQKVSEVEDKYNELLATETDLRASLHGVERTNEELQLRLSEEKEEWEKMLKAVKEVSQQEKSVLSESVARLQLEATTAQSALAEERTTCLAYQQKFVDAARDAEEQKRVVAQLQTQLAEALQDEEKIREIRKLESDLSTLQEELVERTKDLEKQSAEQRQMTDEYEKAIQKKDEDIAEKTAELQQKSEQIRSLSANCDELRRTEVRLKDAEIDLRGKIALIEQLEDNGEKLKASCDLHKTIADDKIAFFEQKLALMEQQYTQERSAHARTRTDLEDSIRRSEALSEKILEKNKAMEELEVRVIGIEDSSQDLVKQLTEVQARAEAAEVRAENAEKRLQEATRPPVVPVEEEPICEPFIGTHDETLLSEHDATMVANGTFPEFNSTKSELGTDFSHLDMMADDEDESVFFLKSIDGKGYEQVANASTSRDFKYKLDRDRIDELNRRNAQVPPSLRCSYSLETNQYSSPSTKENDKKENMNKTSSVKSLSVSSMSSQETPRSTGNNKENSEATPSATAKKTKPPFTRRVSNVFKSKTNK